MSPYPGNMMRPPPRMGNPEYPSRPPIDPMRRYQTPNVLSYGRMGTRPEEIIEEVEHSQSYSSGIPRDDPFIDEEEESDEMSDEPFDPPIRKQGPGGVIKPVEINRNHDAYSTVSKEKTYSVGYHSYHPPRQYNYSNPPVYAGSPTHSRPR